MAQPNINLSTLVNSNKSTQNTENSAILDQINTDLMNNINIPANDGFQKFVFKGDRVGLILTLENSKYDGKTLIDIFSRTLSNLSVCTIFIVNVYDVFKLIVIPNYTGYWIPTMLDLKKFLTAIMSIIPATVKSIRLSNDKYKQQTHMLSTIMQDLIEVYRVDNAIDLAIYNDSDNGIMKKLNFEKIKPTLINPYKDDTTVGIYVSVPK
ncbi:hypothetical protein QKT26_gp66 [Carcinus maenas nudivirus]|uniref:Uncharacterized protein n=1 Tax=Carcinus maenas nudivirus TaxID=2880837 RepID=A0AAE8Y0A3_9VIRU|nr:hypothetical protein QKT26_gp66 [Carcinus maenas nudivirus]UBZ25656.1 hypothetical protein CmNV_065 [Carcinus maenas nudivirus]